MILELLKMVKQGVKNPHLVLEGMYNSAKMEYGQMEQEEIDEIVRRRLICDGCPFMSKNAVDSQEYFDIFGKNYSTSRKDDHCSLCSCPIKTLTASLSAECGLHVYNEKNSENKKELNWDSYYGK